jgi:hypothetical protein
MQTCSAYQRKAIEQFEEALAIYTDLSDRPGQALMLQHLGHCYKALRQFERAAELFERSLAMQAEPATPAHPNERDRLFFPPEAFVRACASETYAPRPPVPAYEAVFTNKLPDEIFANNVCSPHQPESFAPGMRRVRLFRRYPAPEHSAFRWGAVPCPLTATGLAPWVQARMAHIRSMDYPRMQQQMLDFVDMVIDLTAPRRKKRACGRIDSRNTQLWPLLQLSSECRQSVEFWTVFSTVLDYFSAFNEQID